ncbi:MAG: flippase [Nevskia sp.]|nr:flippase [Nevskia sp.]
MVSRILRGQLVGNALSLYAVQGLNYLMPLLMLPFLLRVLSASGYGSIMFAQSLLGYAGIVTDFGFNLTAARDISVARDDPERVARVYWTTMAAKSLLFLVSGLVVGMVVFLTPGFRADWPIFAASGLIVVGNVLFPQWYFQGLERLKEVALSQAVAKCLVAAAAIALVRSPHDVVLAALILSSPQLIGALAALCLGKRLAPARFYRPGLKDIREALGGSWHMFAAGVSTSLYMYTNTFLLGLMCGEQQVGLYSLANKVVGFVQGLAGPVTQAVFPRASLLFDQRKDQAWNLLRRMAWVLLPVLGLAALLLAALAPQVIAVLGGASYVAAVSVLRILAPVPLLVTVATILAQTVMVNLGLTAQLSRIYAVVGVLNLLVLPVLVHQFAADGAAWSLLFAEALGPILMLRVLRQHRDALGLPGAR